jgi:3-oxoacyl-(acyl-carrier-protein) synthase
MKNRLVITGLGVVAPNGVGLEDFKKAIKMGFQAYDISTNLLI